ncbi:hypothetical protein [Photobacterium rosenbergii]|uniref:hypothetical protein n=1 Tax=Photobacterium rosenbergii TaxID=294936 RepID=UPI001C9A1DF2|nr:hypothetical protein [Photobacterium rosenbergii]MBY5946010.1 DDE-type integrase/transposase/recombinase [Photobacterium rosenbergii]
MHDSYGIFKKNQRIEILGKKGFIKHICHEETLVRFEETKISQVFETSYIQEMYCSGELKIINTETLIPTKEMLTDKEYALLEYKRAYVEHLMAHHSGQPTSKSAVNDALQVVPLQINDLNSPSRSTLCRWVKEYQKAGSHIMAFAPRKPGPKRRTRVPYNRLDEIYDALHKYYLCRNPMTLSAIHKDLVVGWKHANISDFPSRSTFYSEVHDYLGDDKIIEAQNGKSAANKHNRQALKKYIVHSILERVEIDSAYINIGLLDDDGNYLGPAILTVAIDVYSRAILGISLEVGRQGESTEHIVDCLRNSILTKPGNETIPEEFRKGWPMCGKPAQIIADAGPGYVSKAFTLLLSILDISRDTTKVRQPWKKPFIERFFGTLRTRLLQTMPGYMSSGRKSEELEPDQTLKRTATLTVNEFKRSLYHFIVNDYHHTPHTGLNGATPFDTWKQNAMVSGITLPEQAHVIRMAYPRLKVVSLDPVKGVQYENLRFNCQELREIFSKLKKRSVKNNPKVELLATHTDMSHVAVVDPETQNLIHVKCTHPKVVPGMTLAETKSFNGVMPTGVTGHITNYIEMTADSVVRKKARDAKERRDKQQARAARNTNKPAKVDELSELMDQRLNDESPSGPYLGSDLSDDNFTGFSKGLWDEE